jgi:SulP family sulfate permease
MRAAVRSGYGLRDLRNDALAGIVVGCVALPLSMALAIASGVPPQHGLYTAMIAGFVIALIGGSRVQVSGPTAAFVVILAPIASQYGVAGLACASAMAGGILVLMGVARLGRLIQFVPNPVTSGFTAGIAVVIATLQLRDFLGLHVESMPDHYVERVVTLARALPSVSAGDLVVGAITLATLIVSPRLLRRIPAPLVALPVGVAASLLILALMPEARVETVGTRFGGIPQAAPRPLWPWALPGPAGGALPLTLETVRALLPGAFAIAMLGAIESLLSSVVAAGMSGTDHHPDGELIAQGAGNIVAPFFGGFAATGAIARTAANVRSGARSPIAAATHAVFLFVAVLAAAPLLAYLPMASMAALLLIVAWNMSDVRHALYVLRVAPRGDVAVLLICFTLTVIFDMTVAVGVGIVLASLLFMRRMAEVTGVRLATVVAEHPHEAMPSNVLTYEVAGPLFFGAAERALSQLHVVDRRVNVVLMDLRAVPTMDATGLVNLQSTLRRLHSANIYTILAGVQEQPLHLMARAGWKHQDWLSVLRSYEHGIDLARSVGTLTDLGAPA